jgi:hypothetical protein
MPIRVSVSAAMLPLTGCAGPIGPPLGLGPEADSVFGVLAILRSPAFFIAHQRTSGTRRTLSLLPFTSCERGMPGMNDARAVPERNARPVSVLNSL